MGGWLQRAAAAALLVLTASAGAEGDEETDSRNVTLHCGRVPKSFDHENRGLVVSEYNATKEQLYMDLTDLLYRFCDDAVYNTSMGTFRVELVTAKRKQKARELSWESCLALGERGTRSRTQASVLLSPTNPVTIFRYAQGQYFLRVSECPRGSKSCQVIREEVIRRGQLVSNLSSFGRCYLAATNSGWRRERPGRTKSAPRARQPMSPEFAFATLPKCWTSTRAA